MEKKITRVISVDHIYLFQYKKGHFFSRKLYYVCLCQIYFVKQTVLQNNFIQLTLVKIYL